MPRNKGVAVPSNSSNDEGLRYIRWLVGHAITLVVGAMLANMPFWSGMWIICGLIPVLALSYLWPNLADRTRWWAIVVVALAVSLSGYSAVREWSGSNIRLDYRVCGAPHIENGEVVGFYFGTEWINPHDHDIFVRTESAFLNVNDKNSSVPLHPGIIRIFADGKADGSDSAKLTNYVEYQPALEPSGSLKGRVRYTFRFGKDDGNLNRSLALDGIFSVLAIDVDGKAFRFSPSSDSSPGYLGGCDITKQAYVRL